MNVDPVGGGTPKGALPLDFEAWAELSARLLQLEQAARLDVLDERGIDVADWTRWDEHHCLALAADIAAGRMDRAKNYGQRCAAELERRRREPAPAPESTDAKGLEPQAEHHAEPTTAAPPLIEAASFQKAPPVMPTPQKAPPFLAGTMAVADFPSFLKQAVRALPFAGNSTPASMASASVPQGRAPAPGETIGLGIDLMALVRPSLPFAQPSSGATFPRLPIESYASLCAELTVFPARATEILKKYGIKDDQARAALDEDWRARLAQHADTRETWQKLCAQYEAYLRQQPR